MPMRRLAIIDNQRKEAAAVAEAVGTSAVPGLEAAASEPAYPIPSKL